MRTPILETERLRLRPLIAADAESAFKNWTSDPDVAKYMRWELHRDITQTREWLRSEEAEIEGESVYNWGFILKETGELIGSGGLVFVQAKGMYELGYNIMKRYWGQGLATEAAQKIIEFGKDSLMQKRFYCCHAKENPAPGRVMTKAGFRYQGDCVYYSWNKQRKFDSKEYILEFE